MPIEPAQFRAAGAICRTGNPTLHFAAHSLPRPERAAVFALYALWDQLQQILTPEEGDIASASAAAEGGGCCGGAGSDSPEKRHRVCISVIEYLCSGEKTGKPELDGFVTLAREHAIAAQPLIAMVDALAQLQQTKRLATWSRLHGLLDASSGSLAEVTAQILAPELLNDPTARRQLHSLAVAIHLTDLLGKLRAHTEAGRVPLPLDDLLKFSLSDAAFRQCVLSDDPFSDDRFAALMDFEIERTENLFAGGLKCLPAIANKRIRRAVAVFATTHHRILQRLGSQLAKPTTTTIAPPPFERFRAVHQAQRLLRMRKSTGHVV